LRLEGVDHLTHRGARFRGDELALVRDADDVANRAEARRFVEEAVLAHPVVVEDLRHVLAAAVGEEDEDLLLLVPRARILDRAGDGRAARTTDEETFEAREIARHEEALAIVDANDVVED